MAKGKEELKVAIQRPLVVEAPTQTSGQVTNPPPTAGFVLQPTTSFVPPSSFVPPHGTSFVPPHGTNFVPSGNGFIPPLATSFVPPTSFFHFTGLGFMSGIMIPPKFKVPDFDKYKRTNCPQTHVRSYYREMPAYTDDEKMLMHFFQDRLSGASLEWYL